LLDDHQVKFLDTFIRAESSFAVLTFTPSMNRITDITRIFNTRLRSATKWTFHTLTPLANYKE